eukprot:620528-Rhodomonas_salina.1
MTCSALRSWRRRAAASRSALSDNARCSSFSGTKIPGFSAMQRVPMYPIPVLSAKLWYKFTRVQCRTAHFGRALALVYPVSIALAQIWCRYTQFQCRTTLILCLR